MALVKGGKWLSSDNAPYYQPERREPRDTFWESSLLSQRKYVTYLGKMIVGTLITTVTGATGNKIPATTTDAGNWAERRWLHQAPSSRRHPEDDGRWGRKQWHVPCWIKPVNGTAISTCAPDLEAGRYIYLQVIRSERRLCQWHWRGVVGLGVFQHGAFGEINEIYILASSAGKRNE